MIRVDRLTIRYGDRVALRDVTLEVPNGSVTAIVGPSGCGKSSLLQAINRLTDLVPGAEVSGSIEVDGRSVHDGRRAVVDLRRDVGMIFQRPNPFPTSIRRNLQLALREHGVRRRDELERTTERVLRDVGLWDEVRDRLDASALRLSGGQQQRLCLARALALEPRVLLMDEPCSALDPAATARVEGLIRQLRERHTILIVTHHLAQARRIADRLAVFWIRDGAGALIESGPTERLFTSPDDPITAAYLSGAAG
ncbi:MAG TPA: phosphate ABC transporter ATP-binding protein [Pirellulaceae bacterium]|nr:phosphate ABC transporter ATP-binding protein [Pirellulaceae bacterium]